MPFMDGSPDRGKIGLRAAGRAKFAAPECDSPGVLAIAAFDASVIVGPLEIDHGGRIRPADPRRGAGFNVSWRGWRVEIALGANSLGFRAAPSRVPRSEVLAALAQLPALLPAGWRISLAPDQRVVIGHETALAESTTACGLITATTDFLLELAPYCTALAEAGLEEGAGGDGTRNV